jgi:peptidoglycan-N-acetylglucosamine deacetylase
MKGLLWINLLMILISCNSKKKESFATSTTARGKKEDAIAAAIDTGGKKKIFLTFDDGPTTGSKRLYELIKQEQLPVTLYLVGEHYQKMPALHKDLDSLRTLPYVVLANHSFSHAWHDKYKAFYSNPKAVIEDYSNAQNVLGITSGIARCAGRSVWRTSTLNITDSGNGPGTAMDTLYKMGYQFTGWDRTWPYDYKTFKNTKNVAEMMVIVKKYFDSSWTKTPNALVLLGHDQQFAKDEEFNQLKEFIGIIKHSKEYEFATMRDYPGIKRIK